jgi:hypothetical protein
LIWVALTTVTVPIVISVEEILTVAPDTKLDPVRVAVPLSPGAASMGDMAVRIGAGAVTVNVTAAVVPAEVVTVTLRAPVVALEAMVRVAVI